MPTGSIQLGQDNFIRHGEAALSNSLCWRPIVGGSSEKLGANAELLRRDLVCDLRTDDGASAGPPNRALGVRKAAAEPQATQDGSCRG